MHNGNRVAYSRCDDLEEPLTCAGISRISFFFVTLGLLTACGGGSYGGGGGTTGGLAPAAPGSVTATPGDTQVTLSWAASSSATSYHVKRSATSGGTTTTVGSPSATTFTDTALTNGTQYFYVVSALNTYGESANSSQVNATPQAPKADITVTLDPTQTHAISPWIYGINSYGGVPNVPAVTLDRLGGNRWTAYNWENNFSNAGSDFGPYSNDTFLSSSTTPAEAVRGPVAFDQAAGVATIVTAQLQGLVSADGNGLVSSANPPDLTRFKVVVDKKSTVSAEPFTLTPSATDASVYMDEELWALDQKFAGKGIFSAQATLPVFVDLDNEPELWNSTHFEVQGPNRVTSDAYIAKTLVLAAAIKDQYPDAVVFGPVHYGFQGIYSWQGELTPTPDGTDWFPDKYLTAVSIASTLYGKPLVDAYDIHWYPEVYDSSGKRILDATGTTLTDEQISLIVQAPRDLWDPTFHDPNNSNPYIYNELGQKPIRILARLQDKIKAEFPAMKGLAVTEYEAGGFNHIAGTVAQADMLGIFGTQGLFAANFWPPGGTYDYALAGFRAFRAFDGGTASFGDMSISATSNDVSQVAVYASLDSTKAGRVVLVAINRSKVAHATVISGMTLAGTATVYQITAASAAGQVPVRPVMAGTMAASGTSLQVTLPAMSVTTIEVK